MVFWVTLFVLNIISLRPWKKIDSVSLVRKRAPVSCIPSDCCVQQALGFSRSKIGHSTTIVADMSPAPMPRSSGLRRCSKLKNHIRPLCKQLHLPKPTNLFFFVVLGSLWYKCSWGVTARKRLTYQPSKSKNKINVF